MPSDRAQHWETVYREQALDRVSWFEAAPDTSMALLRAQGMTPADAVVDIGGGASRLVDALIAQGQAHVGVLDISAAALAVARTRVQDLPGAGRVAWIVADVTRWQPERSYDVWHDRATFHFLNDPDEHAAYRDAMARALRPGGLAVIGTFAKDGPEYCSDLQVQRHDAKSLKAALGQGFTLLAQNRVKHVTPSGATQRFLFATFRRDA